MKKTERLFATILLFQNRRHLRAQDIAAVFEVCKRTVYRDIQALCEAGVSIASEPGGGYRIMAGYYLPPVALTPEEATSLFLGSKFVLKYTDASSKEAAQSAMRKIESILPREIKNRIERLREAIFVPVPWKRRHDTEDRADVLTAIQEAIVHRRVIMGVASIDQGLSGLVMITLFGMLWGLLIEGIATKGFKAEMRK